MMGFDLAGALLSGQGKGKAHPDRVAGMEPLAAR